MNCFQSANGTYLNGVKLTANHDRELRFGDFVGIGVSHIDQEETVNVKDSQYYIFLFKQVTFTRKVKVDIISERCILLFLLFCN